MRSWIINFYFLVISVFSKLACFQDLEINRQRWYGECRKALV